MTEPETPFHDLEQFVALRRLTGLWLSPDGGRLVAGVQQLAGDRKAYVSALWEVDPGGERPAHRLTRSDPGEAGPAFLPDGSLLFVSKRPSVGEDAGDPDDVRGDTDDGKPGLWLLPAGGGEARQVATRPGGIGAVAVARNAGTVVVAAPTLPGAKTADDDAEARKTRKDHGVAAILHESFPVRWWDHDLGPDEVRLLAAPAPDPHEGGIAEPRDLTPEPGRALDECDIDVTPDGRAVVTTWQVGEPRGERRQDLVAVDVASGTRRVLASDREYEFGSPRVSPDGTAVVCVRERRSTPESPGDRTLWLQPFDGSEGRSLTPGLDRWPGQPCWAPDGDTVYFVADDHGRSPVFAVDVGSGEVRRLTAGGSYSHLEPAPDGRSLYALRNAVDAPPAPVRLRTDAIDQEPVLLRGPDEPPPLPGRLEEVQTRADDGTPLRAWLALPPGAGPDAPAPLVLMVHGGPVASWNGWTWRWNPWPFVARGYAVLLPDPGLSTGYGQAFVERGWGSWGDEPYTDVLAVTDEACRRPDIDAGRTAAAGGSFGGYLANWIAGHTDRFRAVVTHASLWALDQMGKTTDFAGSWHREFVSGDSAEANSPHRYADHIRTPMLVVHGDRDYRVPIGEALRLWTDLATRYDGDPAAFPHRFLYFPDENHWVLTPYHAKVWYETFLAFLGWHVLDRGWERPALL